MHVVITGGAGFIGLRLARRLLAQGSLCGPNGRSREIEQIVLFDAVLPSEQPAGLDGRVRIAAGEISDPDAVRALISVPDCSVFHLASVVSAGAERDFDLALRTNLDGGRNVLEACRALGSRPRVVVASTYATWGGSGMPDMVSDTTKQTPQSTYGMTKVVLELLVNDYSRKGFVDGRAARLPTVIVRPGKPNAAASSWVSAIVREPLAGVDYTLPVPLETANPVGGIRTIVAGLVRLHDLSADMLGDDRAVTFPSLPVTAGELLESARRAAGERTLGEVIVAPDSEIVAIVSTWARRASFDRALALGLPADQDLDSIVRAYVEDELL
jgi:nucleoside-diphosphate-sugar epimerase